MSREIPEFLKYPFKPEEIDYRECRFAVHIPKRGDNGLDLHMVKEVVHLKDGRTVPNVRYIPNFKRRYWVTSPRYRTYQQKKEWESIDHCTAGECTQSDLWFNVARSLDMLRMGIRADILRESPWLYGTDIPSTVEVKKKYFDQMKGREHTPFSIAYSDTETNMLNWDKGVGKHIIMQSVFFEGKLYSVILKDFVRKLADPQKELRELYEEHFPDQGKELVKEWEIDLVNEPIDIVKRILLRCHDWKPDFLSFWNMIFDLDKMIECVEQAGYRVEDVFCDPRLPKELRYAYLKRANPSKVSASGRQMNKKPAEQWHTFHLPASFYFVDQMATYRFIRKAGQSDKSYSLDAILGKELKGLSKLKHKPAEGLEAQEFHILMQEKYPGEYCIYHIWDAVCMHLLTQKTKDLDYSLPGTCEYSDFMSFESEPKRYLHKFHYYCLEEHNSVTGVSAKSLVQEFDKLTISTKGHIVTLEPHLTVDNGLRVFKDYPGIVGNFYAQNADLDVKGSYPHGQWCFNMSRMTTVRELIDIEGVRDHVRRIQGLNLSGGCSNAVEFCTEIFHLPSLAKIGEFYDNNKMN